MKPLETRLQKLEKQVNDILRPVECITVMQYAGESNEDSIRLAGYPPSNENRLCIFRTIVKSVDPETGETILTKRSDPIYGEKPSLPESLN